MVEVIHTFSLLYRLLMQKRGLPDGMLYLHCIFHSLIIKKTHCIKSLIIEMLFITNVRLNILLVILSM